MRSCTKCVLPETHETIQFDGSGVCNVCKNIEFKNQRIDWELKKQELNDIISRVKGKNDYDCIVPFSGGKDSTWTLYYLVKEYGLKPLVVRFDHGFLRGQLQKNAELTFRTLGVDVLNFKPNWHTVRKLMLQSLLEKGDFCWHCHTGIFSYPMWVAIKERVPLVIWGEPSSEYTAYYSYENDESVDETRFNKYINLGINADDMYMRLNGNVDKRDLKPFSYPPLKSLRDLDFKSICLGSYIKWDVESQSKIISDNLGWRGDEVEGVPPEYYYEKIECHLQGVRDYIKFLKRGYSRPSHLASIDIRNGRLTRSQGELMVQQFEGKKPKSLEIFLKYIGISEALFNEIIEKHTVSPHKIDWASLELGAGVHDDKDWWCDNGLDNAQADEMISNWKSNQW